MAKPAIPVDETAKQLSHSLFASLFPGESRGPESQTQRLEPWAPAFAGAHSHECERGFTSSGRSAQQGFTLLEMLVALAVFSLAALALVRLQGVTLRTAADLDSKAMGQIVARNLMVELQTDPAPPAIGAAEGDIDNGGRRWHWRRTVKTSDDRRLLQVDLAVDGQPGASPAVLSFVRLVE